MNEIQVSGKTVSDALTEALIKLGTTSDQVDYEVVEKGSAGFLGIGAKPAVLKVWKKDEEKEKNTPVKADIKEAIQKELEEDKKERQKMIEKVAADAPKKEAKKEVCKEVKKDIKNETKKEISKEVKKDIKNEITKEVKSEEPVKAEKEEKKIVKISHEEAEEVKKKAEDFLNEVFKAMDMPVDMNIEMDEATRTLSIDIEGNDMGLLIGKRGQTLDSLQYLISLVANKDSREYIRVKLDTENYRRRRKATLENLAKNIAYKVKRDRKPVVLEPMNPYERRVIHSTLQNDRFVETHSEGVEPYRHIVVTLKRR